MAGRGARQIAFALAADYQVLGVTRHQLMLDPRARCTRNNSCAAIALGANGDLDLDRLMRQVRGMMLADYQPGSDPDLKSRLKSQSPSLRGPSFGL